MTNREKFLQAFAEQMAIPTTAEAIDGTDNNKRSVCQLVMKKVES